MGSVADTRQEETLFRAALLNFSTKDNYQSQF